MKSFQKPQLFLTTLGHAGNGKTSLLQSLLQHLPPAQDSEPVAEEQGDTLHSQTLEVYETSHATLTVLDSSGEGLPASGVLANLTKADIALIVIEASQGFTSHDKYQSFLASLVRVPHIIVAINKMDLVDFAESSFNAITSQHRQYSEKLDIPPVTYIPVSALQQSNIASKSENTAWYHGAPLIHFLNNIHIGAGRNLIDFRFPIEAITSDHDGRYTVQGQAVSGTIRPNESITALPEGGVYQVAAITQKGEELQKAPIAHPVSLVLGGELNLQPGNMLVRRKNLPQVGREFDAIVYWTSDTPMQRGEAYTLTHTTNNVKAFVSEIFYKINVNDLHRIEPGLLEPNEIAKVKIKTDVPVFFDSYRENRATGQFILSDSSSSQTLATGFIKDLAKDLDSLLQEQTITPAKSSNVVWQEIKLSRQQRENRNQHKGGVLWFTGLSGAGKSTIASALESSLFNQGFQTIILDGDNVRHGLCGDLGFSDKDRTENIRRVGEVAKLFFEAGVITLCTFISPIPVRSGFCQKLSPGGAVFRSVCKMPPGCMYTKGP